MTNFRGSDSADRWFNDPAASPDNTSHLDKIRQEITHAPSEKPKFYGLDIGVLKLGFTDDGAFNPGIDLGIVRAQAKVGLVNGADVGVGLGPLADVHAGAYVGADRNGLRGNAGAGAHVADLVGVHGHVDTRLGNATGVDVGGSSHIGPLGSRVGAGVAAGQDGLDAAVGGGVRAGRLAGARVGGHLGLNNDSNLAVGAGGNLGDLRGHTGVGVWSDGNSTFRPDAYAQGRAGGHRGAVDANPPSSGLGRRAAIEVQQLPPIYEAATPENISRVRGEVLNSIVQRSTYQVHKGDTYESIAAKLMPGADQCALAKEAHKLQQLHEANGYKSLRPGQKISTEDPYTIDARARRVVAQHFGWQT